jgi:membrane protease subunit HflK
VKFVGNIFGSGAGDGAGGKQPAITQFYIVVAVAAALYVGSGFYQVQHDERGVVLRFGKWVRTVGPGLQYVLPYPFETAILQKVTTVKQIDVGSFFKNQSDQTLSAKGLYMRARTAADGGQTPEESLMLTGDSNLANISFSVLWKVKSDGVEDYLFNAKSPDVTVRAVSESVMREIVGQTTFSCVQTEGRADIQKKVKDSLQALMDEYKMGIEILRVELQRVEPPASVIDSFRDVERAQAEQQSEKNKAEAYDRDTRARTRGLIAEKVNSGESTKRAIVETAKGAVARFLSAYSQYKLAPDVVQKRLYIETMRDIYSGVDKILIDEAVKAVPYLPLNELKKNNPKDQPEGKK